MKTTYCLDCECPIELNQSLGVASIVNCSFCETQFQIVDIDPVELDWTYGGPLSYEEIAEEEEEEEEEELYHWAWQVAQPSRTHEFGQPRERRLPNRSMGHRRDNERRQNRTGHYCNDDNYEY